MLGSRQPLARFTEAEGDKPIVRLAAVIAW